MTSQFYGPSVFLCLSFWHFNARALYASELKLRLHLKVRMYSKNQHRFECLNKDKWTVEGVGTFGDPPNLTLTHLTRRLTLKLFRLGWKKLVMGGYFVQKQPRGSWLSLPG